MFIFYTDMNHFLARLSRSSKNFNIYKKNITKKMNINC